MTFFRLFLIAAFTWLTSSYASAGVVSPATADVQNLIGDQFNQRDANGGSIGPGEGSVEHVLSHALAGCGSAVLSGGDCAAGAAAASVAAIGSGIIQDAGLTPEQAAECADEITFFSGIGAALTGADQADVIAASGIGGSAFQNNFLFHAEVIAMQQAIDACGGYFEGCTAAEAIFALDLERQAQLDACVGSYSASCTQVRALLTLAAAEHAEIALNETIEQNFASLMGLTSLYRREALFEYATHAIVDDEFTPGSFEGELWRLTIQPSNFTQEISTDIFESSPSDSLAARVNLVAAASVQQEAVMEGVGLLPDDLLTAIARRSGTGAMADILSDPRITGIPSIRRTLGDWQPPAGYVRQADGSVVDAASGQVYTPVRGTDGNIRTNSAGDPIFNTQSAGTPAQTTLTQPTSTGTVINGEAPFDPVAFAQGQQGTGRYPGVDTYAPTQLNSGDRLCQLGDGFERPPGAFFDGTGEAFTTAPTGTSAMGDVQVQVNPNHGPYEGYTTYEVTSPIAGATGEVAANPQFGAGGATQTVIDPSRFGDCLTIVCYTPFPNETGAQ